MKNLRIIILAAGKGTRMKSAIPKILHEIYGRPLIDYVREALPGAGSARVCVVAGYRQEMVRRHMGPGATCVIQKRLLGTADAVRCARPFLRGYRGDVLVLCGDTPLLRKETVRKLIRLHRRAGAACTFLTTVVSDSSGYGRVVRDSSGSVAAIREEIDADDTQKAIAEINAGVYCFQSRSLYPALAAVPLNAKKKEFYLTDIMEILVRQGKRIATVRAQDADEGLGVNSREDLAYCAAVIRRRILQRLMRRGGDYH